MPARAQLDYVQIDVDFFDKPRVQALIEELGPNAALYLLRLYLAIGRGEEARLPKKYAVSLYRSVAITKELAEQTIIFSIQEELLQEDSGFLTLKRIEEDQERVQQKRDKWRGSKQEQRGQVQDKDRTKIGQHEDENETLNTEDLNTEDLNNKEKEIAKQLSTITPEAWNAVKRWAAHRKKLCLSFDSMAAEALQMQYAGRSDALIRDINASITANSRNIFQAPLREEERIKIAATAKAEVLKPVEPQRPKPKPIAPLSEPIEPVKPETMAECRRKIQAITRLATPKVSM